MTDLQVTAVVADAASGKAISSLVDQAINDEGHLDFFFANAGVSMAPKKRPEDMQEHIVNGARRMLEIPDEEFAEVMRINALRYVANCSFWIRKSTEHVKRVFSGQVRSSSYGQSLSRQGQDHRWWIYCAHCFEYVV